MLHVGIRWNRSWHVWEASALPLSYTRLLADFVPKKTFGIIPEVYDFVLLHQFLHQTGYNWARVYSDASIVRGITQKTFSLGAKIVTGGQNVAYAYPNQICTAGSASPIGGGQNQRSLL